MTAIRWLKVGILIAKLMWKYRGPLWSLAKDAHNTVENWAREWKSTGQSISCDEKKARATRLMKAYASSTRSPYLRAKVAVHGEGALEAVWVTKNPRKASARLQGKTAGRKA